MEVSNDIIESQSELFVWIIGDRSIFLHPNLSRNDQHSFIPFDFDLMDIGTYRLMDILRVAEFFHCFSPLIS